MVFRNNNNTEKLRILANGGITFNGDTAAANALDDYEEGTWTPLLSDATNTDATYSIQQGYYTKVGNKVHLQGFIVTTSLGSLTGGLRITGLPFNSKAQANGYASLNVGYTSAMAVTAGSAFGGNLNQNSGQLVLNIFDVVTGASGLTATEFSANGQIMFSLEYQV
jgi:hypothetical protein